MNAYDFDKTIYDGDSTADFYIFSLKRHKKIITQLPSLICAFVKFYVFKSGTKTQFKETMYRFLKFCDIEKDVKDFWSTHRKKIKNFYINQQKDDDVIISASPFFLLEPICSEISIKHLIASRVEPETGKYTGINCHGTEKVKRFYEKFGKVKIDEFYSDSYSDTPMAQIADKAYIVKKDKIIDWNFSAEK
ncbi:MAG: HAD-IB family phosphatase [Clostridiales bacterium]|nr:HAD-IB family phosphatase [Clostridiales bacterium]